ncbi:hypothetical protein BRADI_5g18805v3 [Brachypodium distachyon]|uniref:Uncharacterized protein n=1 Tax=Brachypodium distachyon TaxID=15368 RepID=A0A2K2CI36_BRADI|nr:hypothetical protein BRADI_5g18805v3 [Brachypodium distachyon]
MRALRFFLWIIYVPHVVFQSSNAAHQDSETEPSSTPLTSLGLSPLSGFPSPISLPSPIPPIPLSPPRPISSLPSYPSPARSQTAAGRHRAKLWKEGGARRLCSDCGGAAAVERQGRGLAARRGGTGRGRGRQRRRSDGAVDGSGRTWGLRRHATRVQLRFDDGGCPRLETAGARQLAKHLRKRSRVAVPWPSTSPPCGGGREDESGVNN